MRVKCWTPNPFKGEFDKHCNMDTDPGIYLFVAGFSRCLERTLNMDVWFESFFDVLM